MPNDTEATPHELHGNRPSEPAETRGVQDAATVLSRVPPAVAAEYEAARNELAMLGAALTAIAGADSESDALTIARAVRSRVAAIAVRWIRARKAVADAAVENPPPTRCRRCGTYLRGPGLGHHRDLCAACN